MVLNRRSVLGLGAAVLALPVRAEAAWPTERPLRYIVPVAAGGSQDIVARLLARQLAPALGQNVQVDNLPGAGSNIGYDAAARANPDGYTLLAGSDSLSINSALFPRLGFNPLAFTPVARAVRVPQILVVRADSPARTLEEFVALTRRDAVAVGTPGNGSLAHLLGEVVQAATECRWTHVPYKGGALAVNDLLGGSLQGVLINIGAVTDHVRGGRLRGIFVSAGSRTAALLASGARSAARRWRRVLRRSMRTTTLPSASSGRRRPATRLRRRRRAAVPSARRRARWTHSSEPDMLALLCFALCS